MDNRFFDKERADLNVQLLAAAYTVYLELAKGDPLTPEAFYEKFKKNGSSFHSLVTGE